LNAKSLIFAYCILAVVATCLCIFVESSQSTQSDDVLVLNESQVVVLNPSPNIAQNASLNASVENIENYLINNQHDVGEQKNEML